MQVDRNLMGEQATSEILLALDHRLDLQNNMSAKIITVSDTGSANSVLTITHNLQRLPVAYLWNTSAGAVVDHDRVNWSKTELQVKCTAANAVLTLVIF